nr:MAG: late control gene D protein [Bacteriophage sp.]
MYQASKKFGDAIAGSNRKFNTRLLENEKVLVESVKNFTITSGAEEITIGSAVASYVQATIENKGIALSGKEVSLEIGVEVDGDMEYIPMGLYTIQNPKIESNKVTFTAYDRLASRCNGAYYSKLGYPVDAVDILAEISTMTGVAIDISTLKRGIQINQRAIIEEGDYNEETEESEVITTYVNPFDGYTYKETIGFIAGLFGKFAICGRTGMIEFRWYQGIDYEIPSNIFYNDLQETEESFSIKRLTCDNSDQTLSSGSGATGISMQNPVMTQSILDGVYNTVQGLVFTPAALRFIGDMRLDIGDIVTAVKNDSTKFTIPIISLITSYDGGLMQTIASYGNTAEEDDSDTKGPITEMAERVEYELAFVKKLMVDNLTATNATIKNLSGDVLKFKKGEFENLKSDVASFKETTTTNLNAANAKIEDLEANTVKTSELEAKVGTFGYLKATDASLTYATITNLKAESGKIDDLQSDYAIFKTATANDLKAANANIQNLTATKATIMDLNAATAKISVLEGNYANLNTLVNGNLTSANIQNLTLTSKNTTIENGMIKNAMIENLAFDKITGMDINTTNLTVHSSDGKSKWSDNTIQISDANRVRVQIGKDASNDYSMSVWDKDGKLIWDALGATENTIQRKIIRDSIVADDANISGSKLDINSVIKEVNGSTTKLKSSTIVMNDKNQTLDVVFNEMETTVADNLSSAKLYADGKLSDAQKYALEQANSALSSAKSYADSAVDNIEVGGRNLILNSAFKKSRKEWTDWGNPTTREIISSNGKMWAHIVGNKQNYQGFNQWTPAGSIKEGDHITFSARIKGSAANQKFSVGIHWLNSSNIIINQDWHVFTVDTTENIYTWTVDAKGSGCDKLNLMVGVSDTSAAYNVYFTEIMVVKGNKSSDWTPAPEDTQSQIDNITEITTSHTTSISMMQGQISSLISEDTTIKGNYDALLSRYNATVNTVDSMKTTIGEHTTILNSQNDSIVAVTTKANTIESNLAGTTQTVSEVKSGLTGTQERVAKVETSLTGLTTRVSSTETNLANLEVGGRNLLLNSDKEYIMGFGIPNTTWTDGYAYIGLPTTRIFDEILPQNNVIKLHPEAGKTYTQTIWIETDANIIDLNAAEISWFTGKYGHVPVAAKIIKLADNSYKLTSTYTVTKGDSDIRLFDILHLFSALDISNSGTYLKFGKLKVEQGNVSTDWTPAPEDVDQQITAVETIASQTADKFNWLVKSGTNSTDFELTDRTATLVASAINMNGLVTFSGLNTDLQNTINNKTNVSYLKFSSGGNKQGFFKIATLQVKQNYANQNIIFGVNHREHGYTECRIKFSNAGNTDPGMGSFKQTGTPTRAWRIIKTATSTWDLYLAKTDSWDGGRVIKFDNPYGDGVLVTWSGASADLPDGAIIAEQMITDQTTIDGGIITTGYLSADRIAGGSITADKIATDAIKSRGYVANSTGSFLNLKDGSFDSKYLKWDASGKITAKGGTIGKYKITDQWLVTGSGSTCTGIGGNQAFWAGADSSDSAPFRVGYDGKFVSSNADISGKISATSGKIGRYDITNTYLKTGSGSTCSGIGSDDCAFWAGGTNSQDSNFVVSYNGSVLVNNLTCNDRNSNDALIITGGALSIHSVNNSTYLSSTGFEFEWGGDYRILSVGDGVKCYRNLYATDFIADGWLYASEVHTSGAVVIASDSESFYWAHGYQIARGTSWGGVCVGDDSQQLRLYGSSIWAAHGISTSDENLKENFTTLDQYEDFYMNLNPIGFNYIGDYDGKKTHFGFGAHKTEDILESEGYDSDKFAVVTHRPLVQEDIEKRFGKDIDVDIETEYGVSYTEFIALNTHMIQKTRKDLLYQAGKIDIHEAIINDLQFKIAKMEKKIEQLTKALA